MVAIGIMLLSNDFISLRGRRRKGRTGSSASAKREESDRGRERPVIAPADRASRSLLALRARTPLLPPLYTPATQATIL